MRHYMTLKCDIHVYIMDTLYDFKVKNRILYGLFKRLKRVSRKRNMNPNFYLHCCIIGCHGNSSCNNASI